MSRTRGLFALAVISVLLTVLPGSVATAAPRRADLVVTAVSSTPAEASVGERLRISTTVKNLGRRTAPASKVAFYLSKDATAGKGDAKLSTTTGVRRLARGRSATVVTSAVVPTGVRPGSYRLVACADTTRKVRELRETNNCRATTSTLTVVTRSSGDLITAAEKAGTLTADLATRFRVYSLFDDPRLPARYRGDDSPRLGYADALEEAAAAWPTLSAATRSALTPYYAPPFYEGSAWSPGDGNRVTSRAEPDEGGSPGCNFDQLSQDWRSKLSADGKVRIWWQRRYDATDHAKASSILLSIEHEIWPALKNLMGREPLLDGGGVCEGPDEAIDISLVDADTDTTIRKKMFSCQSPTHILLDRGRSGPNPFVAHELMHSLQYSYQVQGSCDDYAWLREATAQWFMDYVSDPIYNVGVTPDDSEWLHGAPESYLVRPQVSLESETPAPHDYGSYLFFLFVARFDTPNYVRAVWDGTTSMSSLAAVAAPHGNGFEELWKEFVKTNWNRNSVKEYQTWDGLTKQVAVADSFALPEGKQSSTISVDHLASKYFTFVPDKSLTTLEFDNPSAGEKGAGVQAIIQYADGTEKIEDWSDKEHVELCLEDPEIVKITLVLSNANIEKASKLSFPLTWTGVEGLCCTSKTPPALGTDKGSTETSGGSSTVDALASVCPSASGSFVYTETDTWQAAPGTCCSGSSTLTIRFTVRMKPWEDGGVGWGDDGSTYSISYSEQESGRGQFGIAECDYRGQWQGTGGGPVKFAGGGFVEKGQWSPISGKTATGREWLVMLGKEYEFDKTGTEQWSNCVNSAHNYSRTDDPEVVDLGGLAVAAGCPGGDMLWLRGPEKATSFSYSCNPPAVTEGRHTITRSLTGNLAL